MIDLVETLREAYATHKGMYDTVGDKEFGYFALMSYRKIYYIVNTSSPKFSYVSFASSPAAGRAWGHLCEKYERWWTRRNA
jgi:hypothetical protein